MRCDIAEDEEPAAARREAARRRSRSTSPTRRSAPGSSRGSRTCSASRKARPETRRTSSPPGASSSSGSPRRRPTILVFEDMQWADSGLLDFLEYLLEWSRAHPLFVLVLARPELADKRPDLGRRQAQLRVDLPRAALAAGDGRAARPGSCRASRKTLRAADPRARRGRAALRGRDRPHAARPRPARAGGQRLPADRPDRRARGARDAARAHRRATGRPDAGGAAPRPGRRRAREDVHEAGPRVAHRARTRRSSSRSSASLVRKEVLAIQADPRSPERGQYAFLQDIVRHVAYETLSEARAQGEAPRRRAVPRVAAERRRGRDRRGRRRALRRRLRTPRPTTTDADEIRDTSPRDARARGRARGVAGGDCRGAARIRARASS